jgi:hypothetical protein
MCCNEFVKCIPTSFGDGGSVNIFVNYHHNHPLTILDLLQKCDKKLYSNWLTANIFCETTEQNLFTFQRSSIRQAKDTKQVMILKIHSKYTLILKLLYHHIMHTSVLSCVVHIWLFLVFFHATNYNTQTQTKGFA